MDPQKLKLIESIFENIDKMDYVKTDEFVKIFNVILGLLQKLKDDADSALSQAASTIESKLRVLQDEYKRVSYNLEESTLSQKEAILKARNDLKKAFSASLSPLSESITELESRIGTIDNAQISILEKVDTFPKEIEGFKKTVEADKKYVSDVLIEIGGKLTVLEKRTAKGYGNLGAGSEGTGSLFLSRLRDVDVKDATNGQILLYDTTTKKWRAGNAQEATGDITGSGTAGQVTYWNGLNSITGDSNFTWNAANKQFVVGKFASSEEVTQLSLDGLNDQIVLSSSKLKSTDANQFLSSFVQSATSGDFANFSGGASNIALDTNNSINSIVDAYPEYLLLHSYSSVASVVSIDNRIKIYPTSTGMEISSLYPIKIGDTAAAGNSTLLTVNDSSQLYTFSKGNFSIRGVSYVFPSAQGAASTYLRNDGSGNLSWVTSSTLSAAGSDTQVQYNDGGVFGADANYTWNKTTKLVTLTNNALSTTPSPSLLLQNTTSATLGSPAQDSPAFTLRGNYYYTLGATNQPFYVRNYIAASADDPYIMWDYSLNGSSWTNAIGWRMAEAFLIVGGVNANGTIFKNNELYNRNGNGTIAIYGSNWAATTSDITEITLGSNSLNVNRTGGVVKIVAIVSNYNEASGTASNTDLSITRTETALGSGAQKFASFKAGAAGTTEKFYIDNTGVIYSAALTTGLVKSTSGVLSNTTAGTDYIVPTTPFTAGSVAFGGSSNQLTQNNGTFFWDDANTRLLLGVNPSTATGTIGGNIYIEGASPGISLFKTGGTVPWKIEQSTVNQLNFTVSSSSERYAVFNNSGAGVGSVLIEGNLRVGNTTAPTHAITLPTASTGIALYNTADETTNYERGLISWSSNSLTISTSLGGSGSTRPILLQAGTGSNVNIGGSNAPWFDMTRSANSTSSTPQFRFQLTGQITSTSAVQPIFSITGVVNQVTSTGGYTGFLLNMTETSVGSGAKLLTDLQVGGVSRFSVDNLGNIVTSSTATSGHTWYNTADQTTNYEKFSISYVSNVITLTTATGGTGTARNLAIGIAGRLLGINTSGITATNGLLSFPTGTSGANGSCFTLANGSWTASTGTNSMMAVIPTINQSGSAGYNAYFANVTETGTGSGNKYLLNLQVGGVSKAIIDNTGNNSFGNSAPATVNTTDATVTTLQTVAIPATTTVQVVAHVVARRTGGSAGTAEDGASYIIAGTYKNVSGTATLIGAVTTLFSAEDQAGWDCTLDVSTSNVRVRVTGATNNNISWNLSKVEVYARA